MTNAQLIAHLSKQLPDLEVKFHVVNIKTFDVQADSLDFINEVFLASLRPDDVKEHELAVGDLVLGMLV